MDLRRQKFIRRSKSSKRNEKQLVKKITILWLITVISIIFYDDSDESYCTYENSKNKSSMHSDNSSIIIKNKWNKVVSKKLNNFLGDSITTIIQKQMFTLSRICKKLAKPVNSCFYALKSAFSPKKILMVFHNIFINIILQNFLKIFHFLAVLLGSIFNNLVLCISIIFKKLFILFTSSFHIIYYGKKILL